MNNKSISASSAYGIEEHAHLFAAWAASRAHRANALRAARRGADRWPLFWRLHHHPLCGTAARNYRRLCAATGVYVELGKWEASVLGGEQATVCNYGPGNEEPNRSKED